MGRDVGAEHDERPDAQGRVALERAQGGLGSAMAVTLMLALVIAIAALFAFARSREARTI